MLHYTAMADWQAARDWLCNPEAEVSAHYILSEAGDVVPLVDEAERAWHAGAGAWGAISDVNSNSIGIEISNTGFTPFAAAQMDALERLLDGMMTRWDIPAERVIGHSDCSPGRKIDPGQRFDWARLARQGMAIAATPDGGVPCDEGQFFNDLHTAGYTAEATPEALCAAFRLRHRQGHDGPLDAHDCALAADLASRFPVDQPAPTS